MRKQYESLFKKDVDPHDVRVVSCFHANCQSSAQAHLMGIFPDLKHTNLTNKGVSEVELPPFKDLDTTADSEKALPGMNSPFPFIVESPDQDFFFIEDIEQACPLFHKHLMFDEPLEIQRLDAASIDTIQELDSQGISAQSEYGEKSWNAELLARYYDQVLSNYYANGQLPDGISPALMLQLQRIKALKTLADYFDDTHEAAMHTNMISEQIFEDMSSLIFDNDTKVKYALYSGSTKTLTAFQVALEIMNYPYMMKLLQSGSKE